MHKIYSNSDNHHVKATLVYANEHKLLFYDPEFTMPVLHEKGELYELFVNGMIILKDDLAIKPTDMYLNQGILSTYDHGVFIAADIEYDE